MPDLDVLLSELMEIRHRLHAAPELSGGEEGTSGLVCEFLATCRPDEILTGLGGHGVATIFGSGDGPRIMLRCELDALPLPEARDCPWPSAEIGCAHKCGHDGHMAIMLGVARLLAENPPDAGRVMLLFQPAEETATGAAALLRDSRFLDLDPDWIFALHNLPGYPENLILLRPGAFAAGSCGVRIRFEGFPSNAAGVEQDHRPDGALTRIVQGLAGLSNDRGGARALVTVTHTHTGEPASDLNPGQAEILATIRAEDDAVLGTLKQKAAGLAAAVATAEGLDCRISYEDDFPVTANDPRAVEIIARAAEELDLETIPPEESAFRWSEDFGLLARWRPGAMFGLGAGESHPELHGRDYDFNDKLLLPGVMMMDKTLRFALLETPAR